MKRQKIGFIGFGEVGRAFAREMKDRGAEVCYYDIVEKKPEEWIHSLPLYALIQTCNIILATVVSQVATDVAREASQYLHPGKIYADMNSTSPSVKNEVAKIIERSGADFIEGAILSAVGEAGSRASILVCGKKAQAFSKVMNELGLANLRYFSPNVGEASLIKMTRSVFSKGMECLLLEMLIAGRRAGVADYLWKDIVEFMTKNSFDRVAQNWIKTHPAACERRYHEMVQVMETLKEIRVEPIMTRATLDFFQRSLAMELEKVFQATPDEFRKVPDRMEELERGKA